jgi:hypothetical protein
MGSVLVAYMQLDCTDFLLIAFVDSIIYMFRTCYPIRL